MLPATFANDSPERTALRQVSLLPFLDLANLDRSALLIQACAAILVGALVSYVRSWAVPAVLYLTGLQYVAMLTISPQTFRYYYVSGLLLLAIAAAAQGGVGRPSGEGWPAASRIRDS